MPSLLHIVVVLLDEGGLRRSPPGNEAWLANPEARPGHMFAPRNHGPNPKGVANEEDAFSFRQSETKALVGGAR